MDPLPTTDFVTLPVLMSQKKLDKLLEQQQKLQQQIKLERNKENQQQRKDDTRRKILIGAMMLEWIKQGRFSEADLLNGLQTFLQRDSDRSLFDLPLQAQGKVATPTVKNRGRQEGSSKAPQGGKVEKEQDAVNEQEVTKKSENDPVVNYLSSSNQSPRLQEGIGQDALEKEFNL